MPKSMYRKGGMKKMPTSKGNPRKVMTKQVGGGKIKTGRRYGKGGAVTRRHD